MMCCIFSTGSSLEAPYQPSSMHSRNETSPSNVTPDASKSKDFRHQNTEKCSLPSNHNMGKADTPPVGSAKMGHLRNVSRNDSFVKENRVHHAEGLENMSHSPQSNFHGIPHALAGLSESEAEKLSGRRSEHELGGSKAFPQKSFQKYTKVIHMALIKIVDSSQLFIHVHFEEIKLYCMLHKKLCQIVNPMKD